MEHMMEEKEMLKKHKTMRKSMGGKKKKKLVRKSPFSQEKAKMILREKSPTLHGRPITSGQRGLLGLIAGGGTPRKLT